MLEMFGYDFMQRAFLAGTIIGVLASFLGSFVVLRRYSLLADTLAHVALVGVATGLLTRTSPIWMSIAVTLASGLAIEYLRSVKKIYSDSLLAIFLSGGLALAVIIIGLAQSFNTSLFSYLFGSIAATSRQDLVIAASFGGVAIFLLLFFYKELFFIAFDEEVAKASGIRVSWLNLLLVSLTAVTIALSIRVVGALLIGALLVIPASTAMLFRRGFGQTVLLSILFSLLSVFAGLFLSYHLALASGATIVMVAITLFALSLLLSRRV